VVVAASQHSARNSELSLAVFQAINGLPGALRPVVLPIYHAAALWAVGLVVLAALAARRLRLARDLLLAGVLGWTLSRGLGLVLANGLRPGLSATLRSRSSTSFPNVPLSLLVAVVSTGSPYLTRPVRRVGLAVELLLVPSALYLGVALPKSLLCAAALGTAVAAAVHLAVGSPGARPTTDQVRLALHELGVVAAYDVTLAPEQPAEHTLMLASDGTARLTVKVLGRDERQATLLTKVWKLLLYKDSGPTVFLTRLQEVEHQAYLSMLARAGGVRVPPVVAAGTGGPGTALLAERELDGPLLRDVEEVSDGQLADLWAQVAQLHHSRIAHGRLNTGRVVVTADGCAVTGLSFATGSASGEQRAGDTAELLATSALVAGPSRTAKAAVASLGAAEVAASLPLLQLPALSREARRILSGQDKGALDALRQAVAQASGTTVPQLEQLRRLSGTTLALTVGTLVGVGALLGSVGDPQVLAQSVIRARPGPLVLAVVLALGANVGFALALAGSIRRRLPFWPNLQLQVAGTFSNLALPFGSQALQVRFLQKQGVDGARAVAAGGLVNLTGSTLTQVALFAVTYEASPRTVDLGQIPTGAITTLLGVGVALVLLLSVVGLGVPALRRRVVPPVARGLQTVNETLRSPRQLALLVGGSVLAYSCFGLALGATLHAFGEDPSLFGVVAANTGVTLVAALVPFPGGTAAVSSIGLSGALVAIGVPQTSAVGAVLLHQLITQYVPAVPGWFALRRLVARDDL